MELAANPDAIITLTVNRYLSVTQGTMVTARANPDVTSALVADAGNRISRKSNNSFEITGGDPHGNNPLVLRIEVLPAESYAAVGLIVKNVNNVSEGGITSWDSMNVGNGAHDNSVTVTDKAPLPQGTQSITYELYMLIRPKANAADYPVGDIGLIDPRISNF